ncbi:MAG TPA: 3-phosphoserine/phosphohydroxythreonine transaminase [Burkholderiales bacterium]|nr:3-phosphoserine/phosphohydroxythreonine transaminase [Burkholderiales bacterium]
MTNLFQRRLQATPSRAGAANLAAAGGQLPAEVLERTARDLTDWRHSARSVLALPFTGREFMDLLAEAVAALRTLLAVPANYRVLFLQGGASAQFALVPMNLLRGRTMACYADTGYWSRRAIAEAQRYCEVEVLPPHRAPAIASRGAYLHLTSNETADGRQYREFPDAGALPLVADMTSDFLTRPIDVSRFGLIYASAQKNIGAAGLTVVIVRQDLLGSAHPATPTVFDYLAQAHNDSLYNTPPMFAVYLAGLVFKWLLAQGGLEAMQAAVQRKSAQLYEVIDRSGGFYRCTVAAQDRSQINVCFWLAEDSLTPIFLREAEEEGFLHLAGHPRVGGIRASLYNAVSEETACALASFMSEFARRHG